MSQIPKAKLDPVTEKKVSALRQKAKTALVNQKFEEARDYLDEAIVFQPYSYKLYRLRSIASASLQDFSLALADANHVISLAPNITDGWYHKGYALYNMKQYGDAAHAFQEGLKLNPTDKVLRQGFWDAITLVSQSRTQVVDTKSVLEGNPETDRDAIDEAYFDEYYNAQVGGGSNAASQSGTLDASRGVSAASNAIGRSLNSFKDAAGGAAAAIAAQRLAANTPGSRASTSTTRMK